MFRVRGLGLRFKFRVERFRVEGCWGHLFDVDTPEGSLGNVRIYREIYDNRGLKEGYHGWRNSCTT